MNKSGDKADNRMLYTICGIAATGGLLFGFDTGIISGALLLIKQEWTLTSFSQEWVVSAVLLGAILGAALSGRAADRFGRRDVIIGTSVLFAVGSGWAGIAHSVDSLITSRVIVGFAIGVASFTVPLYISEIAPRRVRGALVSLNQLAITIGIVVSYLVDDAFAGTSHGWRYMFLAGIAPALVLGIGMLFMPESPRWLIAHKRKADAGLILDRVMGPEQAAREMESIEAGLSKETKTSWSELAAPWMKMPLFIGVGIVFVQQMTGINTVIYYAPTIFQMAGFESNQAAIGATVGVGAVNVLMTVVAIWLIDKVGRKPLLYIGLAGMIASLAVLGIAFKASAGAGGTLKWVSVGSLLVYIASFAVSLGPIAWLIISEIYPFKVRGVAMSLATLSNWSFNFIVAMTFLTIVEKLGPSIAFWTYGIVGVAGLIFCYRYVPETKGRSLEEIEEHWYKRKHPRDL